jgi:hypothetical protein
MPHLLCEIPTIFQKSLACLNENRYLPPNFERSTAKNTHPRRDRRAREETVIEGRKAIPWSGEIGTKESVGRNRSRKMRRSSCHKRKVYEKLFQFMNDLSE